MIHFIDRCMGFLVCFRVCPSSFPPHCEPDYTESNYLCRSQLRNRLLKDHAQLFSGKLKMKFCFKLGKAKDQSDVYDKGKSDE